MMIREGYPPREAAAEYINYRSQVREAISSWKTTLLAGLISGVSLGISIIGLLAIGAIFMWTIQMSTSSHGDDRLALTRKTPSPSSSKINQRSPELTMPDNQNDSSPLDQVLGFTPAAGATATVLGIAFMGLAAIEKLRRRREGTHVRMRKRDADTSHLALQLLLWTFVFGVLSTIIYLYIGSREANAFIGLGIVLGFPASFVIRYYFYRSYPTILAYISNAPAGRESRRIVEYELAPKADTTNAPLAPKEQNNVHTKHARPIQRSGSRRVKPRYITIYVASVIGWWGLVRWWTWMSSNISFVPFTEDIGTDVNGLVLGSILGVGLTVFYIRVIEDS